MSFLDHIARCNNADLSQFEPWYVGGTRAGFLHRDFLPTVAVRPDLFSHRDGGWYLEPSLDSPAKRTAAMRAFLLSLRERGLFGRLWREEPYKVSADFHAPLLLEMERAAVPWFGVRAYGPHMTGYVRKRDGLHIWVPRRSYDKPTFPGELDNTVAGGQPAGIGILENLIKECAEEAAIPRSLAEQAKAVGFVAYWNQSGQQLKPDVMSCFDLELPEDFTPHAHDGEVHAFELWPAPRVYETVRDSADFKYNCNLVLIDFFIRHGMFRADDAEFFAIAAGLHRTHRVEKARVVADEEVVLMRVLLLLVVASLAFSMTATAQDSPDGRHGHGHAENHDWYKELKQPDTGYSCCNGTSNGVEGDCRPTRAYLQDDGTWKAMIDGRWTPVPPRVVLKSLAPDGNSHICAGKSGMIYCFIGGSPKS